MLTDFFTTKERRSKFSFYVDDAFHLGINTDTVLFSQPNKLDHYKDISPDTFSLT